jgi:hypothetical protein
MKRILTLICVLVAMSFTSAAFGAEDVGSVVALKGRALINRESKTIEAKLKEGVILKDIIETKEKSRAKLLFVDESVLTLKENSKASIKDFVYSREKGGSSVFTLLDGAMRTVVGKTNFEVHTPTTVASARGTVIDFIIGISGGVAFTTIMCFEGEVIISSSDPNFPGIIVLKPGMMITVFAGQPLPEPEPIEKGKMEGFFLGGLGFDDMYLFASPPIDQQPSTGATPVDLHLVFP